MQKVLRDKVMDQVDKDYEVTILRTAIDIYLDKTIAFTEECLQSLKSNRDCFVWELSTNIYSQSGHKVGFHVARDGVNAWLEKKKVQLVSFAGIKKSKLVELRLKMLVGALKKKFAGRSRLVKLLLKMLV